MISPPKCANPLCARDSVLAYRGDGKRGRPPAGATPFPRYCLQCHNSLANGRKPGGKLVALQDVIQICEFHNAPELAALFRDMR